RTVDLIRQDGFPIIGELETLHPEETWVGRSFSFATLAGKLTALLSQNKPDILFVAGDREEPMAAAIVANFLGIPVAHLHGGDRCIASDVDEIFRPAISKLSHLHFTATEGHRERLIKMGELPEHVWAVGAPGLDRLKNEPEVSLDEIGKIYGADLSQPFFILIQHPSSTLSPEAGYQEMNAILEGILSLNYPVFCSYPNTDPGNELIRKSIDENREKYPDLITYNTLPREHFVSLYRSCSAIVGNSSSIVLEAGFLRRPGILIGPRQNLREVGNNVVRISPTVDAVKSACQDALDENYRLQVQEADSIYGDGLASGRIAKILTDVEIKPELLLKTMPY
ncbi:MAG: UDP-N-acetylglucosamine 2-epimerase, partial [Aggregatilineales bacterium]